MKNQQEKKPETRKPARTFQDLIVWKKAHRFVLKIYSITKSFPKEERYGLVSQFRRAAISIPANIAEGFRRRTKTEKARFLNIAQSSLEECRYYIILSIDLKYIKPEKLPEDLEEVSRILEGYIKSILRPD